MSVNYASGLSDYPHKGKCGQQEFFDTGTELDTKVAELHDWVRKSKHCVILTGAGISTSTGIPDFRGPAGVWTLEERGVAPQFTTTFDDAIASAGHMALVAMEKAGIVKYLITQNVDGLHIRSGFPRDSMSVLHGDMFVEQCDKCGRQYIRRSSVKTMGLKYTGGSCVNKSKRGNGCRGKLRDTILDWEDSLPDDALEKAIEHCKDADLCIVLGSSLQIVPAGNLPLHCKKNSGKIVSVNLQRTKHHKKTDLVIHSRIDVVMEKLCEKLGVVIPKYTRPAPVLYSTQKDVKSCVPLNVTLNNEWSINSSDESIIEDIPKTVNLNSVTDKKEHLKCDNIGMKTNDSNKRKMDLPIAEDDYIVKKEAKLAAVK